MAEQALLFRAFAPYARFVLVNGELGMVNAPDDKPMSVTALTVADGRITGMCILADLARPAGLDLPDLAGQHGGRP